ncbi:unnamed protein product [Durusdinium trenchii]|uniref:V-type proton ATPase subunit a n=1 Tax=Durusdinium trenchii TaxID=1381693 RepID=A0ABP0P576_9DINO
MRRPYRKHIQRIDEMERILRFLVGEISGIEGCEILKNKVDEFMRFEDAYTLEGVETELQSLYKHFMKFKENNVSLTNERNQAVEEAEVVAVAKVAAAQPVCVKGGRYVGGLHGRSPPGCGRRVLRSECQETTGGALDGEGEVLKRLGYLAGVVPKVDEQRFTRALWQFTPISETVKDPKTGQEVQKSVFVVYFQGAGGPMQQKVMKVCSAFGVNMYNWPVSSEQAASRHAQLKKVVAEKDAALKGFADFMRSEAQDLLTPPSHSPAGNSKIEEWRLFCIKEKAIYNILNLCSGEIALRVNVWYPATEESKIIALLQKLNEPRAVSGWGEFHFHASGSECTTELDGSEPYGAHGDEEIDLEASWQIMGTREGSQQGAFLTPEKQVKSVAPTYIRVNDFTEGWQEVIDTYGIPKYQEANPALLSVVTFPFIFGMMYGDVGHGTLLFLAGLWLCKNAESLRFSQPTLFMVRYMVVSLGGSAEGFFATYAGLMYNDFFSVGLQIFDSRWKEVGEGIYEPDYDAPGRQARSSNELLYVNSLKMKLSVLFGVLQMTVGLFLRWGNAFYEKNMTDFICECIPMMIFMLCFFGWMDVMILYKWVHPIDNPPSIINSLICMAMGQQDLFPLWDGSVEMAQNLMLPLGENLVPIMLFPKPFILLYQHNQTKKVETNVRALWRARDGNFVAIEEEPSNNHHGRRHRALHETRGERRVDLRKKLAPEFVILGKVLAELNDEDEANAEGFSEDFSDEWEPMNDDEELPAWATEVVDRTSEGFFKDGVWQSATTMAREKEEHQRGREKVTWKKNRPGHHARYQQRRQQRESEMKLSKTREPLAAGMVKPSVETGRNVAREVCTRLTTTDGTDVMHDVGGEFVRCHRKIIEHQLDRGALAAIGCLPLFREAPDPTSGLASTTTPFWSFLLCATLSAASVEVSRGIGPEQATSCFTEFNGYQVDLLEHPLIIFHHAIRDSENPRSYHLAATLDVKSAKVTDVAFLWALCSTYIAMANATMSTSVGGEGTQLSNDLYMENSSQDYGEEWHDSWQADDWSTWYADDWHTDDWWNYYDDAEYEEYQMDHESWTPTGSEQQSSDATQEVPPLPSYSASAKTLSFATYVNNTTMQENHACYHAVREESHRHWPDHAYTFWQQATGTTIPEQQRSTRESETEAEETCKKPRSKTVTFQNDALPDEVDPPPEPLEDNLMYHLQDLPLYQGDQLPEGLNDEERKKLIKDYKAMPEEFYTRTNRRMVTPSSFPTWFAAAKKRKTKWHVWEWCSGSGRLSLTCCLASLVIGFPVDYRYGWDLGNPSHQAMLRDALYTFEPEILIATPRCKFWSVSSSRRNRTDLLRDRESERPTLTFIQESFGYQVQQKKSYLMEQPWSSSMWTESLMVRNKDFPQWQRPRRTDQCAFGAVDEKRIPVLKATGLEAYGFKLKMPSSSTTPRCLDDPAHPVSTPWNDFQRAAHGHKGLSTVQLTVPVNYKLANEETVLIKHLLCMIVEMSMNVFEEANGTEFHHWIRDPILLSNSRSCLKSFLYVLGIHVALHPFSKAFPEPELSAEAAPLRLCFRGEYRKWRLHPLEDLRELSPMQQRTFHSCSCDTSSKDVSADDSNAGDTCARHAYALSKRTILIWLKNTTDYVKVQKEDDRHMRLKKEYHVHWDSMCTLYFLYYPIVTQEPPPVSQPASTSSAQPSAIQGDTPPEEMEVESTLPSVPSKRMEPEVRSPALVPDKKPRIYEAFPSYDTYQTLHTLHWMLDRKKMNRLRLQDFWASTMEIPRWMNGLTMEEVNVHFSCQADQVRQRHASYLVHQPGSRLRHVHLDLAHGGSYLSLTDELNIKEEELADLWPLVEEADAKELAQFVQEKAFEKEARVSGRLRYLILAPTGSMLADSLTKPMLSLRMMMFLSTGYVEVENSGDHRILLRRLPTLSELQEEDLFKSDKQIKDEVKLNGRGVTSWMTLGFAPFPRLLLASMMMYSVAAQSDQPTEHHATYDYGDLYMFMMMLLFYMTMRFMEYMFVWCTKPTEKQKKKHRKEKESDSESGSERGPEVASASNAVVNRSLNLEPPKPSTEFLWFSTTGEIFIHQIIETIEFVLGTVSHTASYLRIWALSLAHQQLSLVFFQKTITMGLEMSFPLNGIVIYLMFGAWFGITLAVLLGMDVLECFLHTLRLHWVEFQSKFYKAEGLKFAPFSIQKLVTPTDE